MLESAEIIQPTTLKQQVERQLSIRGVSVVEFEKSGELSIPAVPEKPRLPESKQEAFKEATRKTLQELGLPENTSSYVREYGLRIRDRDR